ncbi:hypothetical protein FHL15_006281 [Xylaria flabelliformis]|uniref:Uncharacterized protein n=1 Tax=Xylaria flabelliformis TaxID=2512241 RepID=A0A553HY40_9PEZI|nr:hypothetical protein FHL15_006281 [Xylaria flabelliformis]
MKLTVLRDWLEAKGEPPDDLCLAVIHHFRPDLEAAMFDVPPMPSSDSSSDQGELSKGQRKRARYLTSKLKRHGI